jgi:peptidoglycan/xylan/chitin deacetylase (PgdA/CDA1 family)
MSKPIPNPTAKRDRNPGRAPAIVDPLLGELDQQDRICRILGELDHPPRLSLPMKSYYLVRPLIPVSLRHGLQAIRTLASDDRWYLSAQLIDEYLARMGEENFQTALESLWPNGNRSAIVLTHDIETAAGLDFAPRVMELEKRYGFPSSWNLVPYLYPIAPAIVDHIRAEGNEIGIHGFNHDGKLYFSKRIFDRRSVKINQALEAYRAVGFRSAAVHRNLFWLQNLNIAYDASCFDVDPFQPMPGGTCSLWPFRVGKFVELPYTMPQDHVLWIRLKETTNRIWEDKARWLFERHGMIMMITHPDYLRMGDNLERYEEFLGFLGGFPRTWKALPRDVARHWVQKAEAAS